MALTFVKRDSLLKKVMIVMDVFSVLTLNTCVIFWRGKHLSFRN
jgi:hypothetical protein